MRQVRTSFVVLVVIAVFAVAVPAQARSMERAQPASHTQDGSWMGSTLGHAMTWLARLAGNEPPAVSRTMKSFIPPPPPTGSGGSHNSPQSGGCIDPLGMGRCNN